MSNAAIRRALILLLIFAAFLRFWGLDRIGTLMGDEPVEVPHARSYAEGGPRTFDWYHPPLHIMALHMSMEVFGDNPYGWRMRNVVFGSLSVLFLFLLGREIFGDIRVSLLAGVLLSLDAQHLQLSRSSANEIQVAFFMLIAVYFVARYVRGDENMLIPAGIFAGLAHASKWLYLAPWAVVIAYLCILSLKKEGERLDTILRICVFAVILPAAIYVFSFYSWFSRGYDIHEFFRMQIDSYSYLQSLSIEEFSVKLSNFSFQPYALFFEPIFKVIIYAKNPGLLYLESNSPPFSLLVWPATLFVVYHAWKRRDMPFLLPVIFVLLAYIQFLLMSRPVFTYLIIGCIPFAYLLVAFFIVRLLERFESPWPYRAVLGVTVLWGLYLYPLMVFIEMPRALYAPVLYLAQVVNF